MANSRKKAKERQLEANRTGYCTVSETCEKYPGSEKECKNCKDWKMGVIVKKD